MSRLFSAVKWVLTLGSKPQTFLDAKWIVIFLDKIPLPKKRIWALRILNLSPHYFISSDAPEFNGMRNNDYLEAVFKLCNQSRDKIFEILLKDYLDEDYEVIDYGCGPGFLARAASPYVKKIYGLDISGGAIACAKVVNSADNIEYLKADRDGLSAIDDESVDAIYSYAVVQHLTDEVFNSVLRTCRQKLKFGGRLLLHIQLTDEVWRTENDWKNDTSIVGHLKYNYGLHCFGRTEGEYIDNVRRHGFDDIRIQKLEGFDAKYDEELQSQRLLTALKAV